MIIPTLGISPAALISSADQALYRAKANGRDRIVEGSIVIETELRQV